MTAGPTRDPGTICSVRIHITGPARPGPVRASQPRRWHSQEEGPGGAGGPWHRPSATLTGRPPAASAPSSAPRTAPGAALSPLSRWCYHPTASFRCPGHPDRQERLGQQMLPGKGLDVRLRPSPPRCGMRSYNHCRDLSETSPPGPIQVPLPARPGEARLT